MSCWKNWLEVISKKKTNKAVALIFIFFCCFLNKQAYAEVVQPKKVVIISINNMSLDDFIAMKNVNMLMTNGAVGLMNTRGAKKTDNISAYATLGWGTRADAEIYHCETQIIDNLLYTKNINDLKEYNKSNLYNAKVGWLGDFFHKNNLKTALICNGYNTYEYFIPASLVLIDQKGIIDNFRIINGEAFRNVNYVNFQYLYNSFIDLYAYNDCILINIENVIYSETTHNDYKEYVLKNINDFIGNITEYINNNTLLIVLSPNYSSYHAQIGKKLTPIVFYGKDIEKGLLTSNTTRRNGVIGNIDIAPTVAKYFSNRVEDTTGQPINIKNDNSNILKLQSSYKQIAFNSKNRVLVLKTYVIFQIILLITILIILLFKHKYNKMLYKFLELTAIFALICPFTLLIISLFKIYNIFIYFIVFILLNILVMFILHKITHSKHQMIIYISLITSLMIIVDLVFFNGYLNKTSILGYDSIIGARYYGLGNEYMGILIGSTLLSIVPLVCRKTIKKQVGILLLISIVAVIGLSKFGANVGGTITALFAFGIASLNMLDKKISFKNILILVFLIFTIIIAFGIYDIYFSKQKSHLAQALINYKIEGIDTIIKIIQRKLKMNIKLLKLTMWSRVLVVSLIVMVVLFIKPPGILSILFDKYNDFSISWYCILIAGICGMFVNDSGVVVAATCNIFMVFSLLYFLLGDMASGICTVRKYRT